MRRKIAIQLEIKGNHIQRQPFSQNGNDFPGHSVSGIHHHLERLYFIDIHKT